MTVSHPPVDQIFAAALERPAGQLRSDYVADACSASPELRDRVERLLRAHAASHNFLASPVVDPKSALGQPVLEGPGTVIGPYKLLKQIGQGGMGTVFQAEQRQPVQRGVALKIINPGMDSRPIIARFEAERQALALMDHPNIAKVLDAGTTGTGRPYFVMELVNGVPITQFCNHQRLTPRQRLELFLPVCQAIQHAHQKGIIHRDIKPSNVLVGRHEGQPVVKVIDFGIAKATGQSLTERSLFTEFGALLGTLEYMSPEQAELNNHDIDTRSDIYSLGVLLYELLTGATPLDRKRLDPAALLEMLRLIREEEPSRPSARLSALKDMFPTISAQRRIEPARLKKLLQGELDWIVMKCLEKDRSRRYETANSLASDVQRYLHDEPVEACPPSAAYRLRKFARRNLPALATAALVALALVLGTVVSTWQAIRATKAEDLAHARLQAETAARRDAEQARRDAELARDGETKQRELADQERDRAEQNAERATEQRKLADQQRQRAERIAQRASELEQHAEDRFKEAHQMVDEWFAAVRESEAWRTAPNSQPLRRKLLSSTTEYYEKLLEENPQDPKLQKSAGLAYYHLALAESAVSRQKGIDLYLRALAMLEPLVEQDPADTRISEHLSIAYWNIARLQGDAGQVNEALLNYARAITTEERLMRDNPAVHRHVRNLAISYNDLAILQDNNNRSEDALGNFEQALRIRERIATENPRTSSYKANVASTYSNMSLAQRSLGRLSEAVASCEQARTIQERLIRENPTVMEYVSDLGGTLNNLALALLLLEREVEAFDAYQRAIELQRRAFDTEPSVAQHREFLSNHYVGLAKMQRQRGLAGDAFGTTLERKKLWPGNASRLYAVARDLALCVPLIGKGKSPPSEEDQRERERCVSVALETLSEALAAGFRDFNSLSTNADLEPLRGDMRFRQLVDKYLGKPAPASRGNP